MDFRSLELDNQSSASANLEEIPGQHVQLEVLVIVQRIDEKPCILHYLITDLEAKLKYLLHYQKKVINIKKQDDSPLWMKTFKDKSRCLTSIRSLA